LSVFRLLAARSANSETFYQGALVGREAEVERLLAAAQPVLHHQFAGVCYVSGEAGIGKSRLVYSARQRLAAQTPLLWMYCPSDDVLRGSLRPFVTFLKDYFRQSAQHDEVTNKARFADVLNRLIAVLSSSPTHNAPTGALAAELERTRSFLGALLGLHWNDSLYSQLEPKLRFDNTLGALATLIQAESMRQPVWLELEDAHWLDPDSQTLVASLCGALVGYPVVIVCAARPDDAGRPFAVSLAAHTPVCALDLAALAPESTRALATQTLDRPVSEELTRFVYERTGGNPFFAEQLLLDLRERGLLDQQHPASADPKPALTLRASLGGSASALNDVPDTLNSLLVARLDRLDEPVRAVVQTAAVLGREWALPVLAAMHAGDPTLAPKVRAAEDGRVWSPLSAHNYLFRHVLLRDAAYGMQERARLRSLHQRAAQAIEQEYAENLAGQYAALAYHYRMAEERERERYYARLGGKAAAARYANAEAVALLSRALELTPEAALEERWELLLTRERVYELQGAIQAQDHDLFALEALSAVFNQPARRIEVALRRANYTSIVGDYTQGEALCQQALALCEQIGDQRGRMAVFIRLGILAQAVGDYSRARDYCEQAVVLAQAIGDRAGECDALGKRGYLAYFQDDYSAAEADLTRALQIAQELGDQRNEGDLLARLGNLLSFQGRNAAARTYLQQALGIVRSIGDQNEEAWALGSMGALALDTGHYSEAQSCLRQALQISRASNRKHDVGYLLARLGQVAYQTGDLATAHEHYTQSLALALEVGDSTGEGWVRNMLSAWLYLQAQYDAAHTEAHKVVQIGQAISDHAVHAAGLTSLGQALVQLGQLDAAEQAYAQALHLRQQIGLPHVAAESLAGLAALALVRDDLAQARLHVEAILTHAAAGVVFDGTPTPFLIELTCYEVLRAANDERAAAVLHAAYQRLMLRATALPDEAARRMFLDQVPCHRAVAAAWHEQQAQITQ
jgi:tetratricopeptide (TPR) repeat protein